MIQRSNDIEFETAVMIPSESCGIVIGQGGRNIKRIREVTGVRAFLEQEDPEKTEKKPLYLHGSIQGVQTAMAMVNDLLNGRGIYRSVYQPIVGRPVPLFASSTPYYFPSGSGGGGGGGGASNGVGGNLASSSKFDQARMSGRGVEVEVPGFAVGFIIGKRGDQIRALCEQTGTNIQFNRNDTLRGSEVHHAYIEGTPDQVEKCIERMNEMVTRLYHELCTGQRLGGGAAATTGDIPTSQQSQFYQSAGLPSQLSSFAQSSSVNQWAGMPLAQSGYYGLFGSGQVALRISTMRQYNSSVPGVPQQQAQLSTQTGTVDYTQAWVHYYEAIGDHQQANVLREGLKQQQTQSAMAMSFPALGSGSGGCAGGEVSSAFPNRRS